MITYVPADDRPYLHPGRHADVVINDETMGYLGEIHPEVADNYNLGTKTYVAVMDVELLAKYADFDVKYEGVAKFPAVTRDISLVMKKDCTGRTGRRSDPRQWWKTAGRLPSV